MSFMGGFGESFSRSFENAKDRRAVKENEVFRMTYADYLDRQKEDRKRDTETTAKIRRAKTLAQLGGAPEEAWTNVYEMLDAGLDESNVLTTIRSGKWEQSQGAVDQDGTQTSPAAPSPATEQTVSAGMADPAVTTPPVETATANPWDVVKSKFLGPKRNPTQKAYEGIAKATGVPVEQVTDTMTAVGSAAPAVPQSRFKFTPAAPEIKPDPFNTLEESAIALESAKWDAQQNPTPENQERLRVAQQRMNALQTIEVYKAEAKARAEGVSGGFARGRVPDGNNGWKIVDAQRALDGSWIDDQGQPIQGFKLIDQEQSKAILGLTSKMGKPLTDYNERKLAATSIMRDYGQLGQIVAMTKGQVLAPLTTGAVGLLDDWANDLNTAVDVFSQRGGKPEEFDAIEKDVDERLRTLQLPQNAKDLANARSLFESKVKILAYRVGSMVGQEGNSLARQELENLQAILTSGTSEQKFWQNASALVMSEVGNLKVQQRTLNEGSGDILGFEAAFGWKPFDPARSIEDDVAADPELRGAYEKLKKTYSMNPNPEAPKEEKKKETSVKTINSKEEYDALKPGELYTAPDAETGEMKTYTKGQ